VLQDDWIHQKTLFVAKIRPELDEQDLASKAKTLVKKTLDHLKKPPSKGKDSVGSKRHSESGGGIMEGG
jgi:hypothetical protein